MQRLLVRSKAKGTIRGYTSSINSWLKYAAENDLPTNPATTFGVTRYITMLADSNVGVSALAVLSRSCTSVRTTTLLLPYMLLL